MLYERWREIAVQFSTEVALRDLAAARCWTFRQLDDAANAFPTPSSKVVFPQGIGADFVIAVLAAWRARQIVCPVEVSHATPVLNDKPPDDIVHLKTTSATTGTPKLVAFRAEQLMADAENIVSTMGLRRDWPNLGVLSLAHSYGFSNLVLPLLLHGIPLILVGSALPEPLKSASQSHPSLTLAAVPALWRTWHEARSIPPSVRLAISAGAPLPLGLEQEIFSAHGIKVHNFYGSSECGGIAYDRSLEPRTDPSLVGEPLENVQVSVAEDGCLEVRGRAVADCYWPETIPSLANGVFRTCDLAEIRAGHVHLRGRAGDQINIAGRKVSPETVERALVGHSHVRDCVVFGVPSEIAGRGETIVACVALSSPASPASPDSLKAFLAERLPAWQLPREWWFVQFLEFNERGKISRSECRKRFLDLRQTGGRVISST